MKTQNWCVDRFPVGLTAGYCWSQSKPRHCCCSHVTVLWLFILYAEQCKITVYAVHADFAAQRGFNFEDV